MQNAFWGRRPGIATLSIRSARDYTRFDASSFPIRARQDGVRDGSDRCPRTSGARGLSRQGPPGGRAHSGAARSGSTTPSARQRQTDPLHAATRRGQAAAVGGPASVEERQTVELDAAGHV
jgi:hypothetical protein